MNIFSKLSQWLFSEPTVVVNKTNDFRVVVQIIPSKISDIVSKNSVSCSKAGGSINDPTSAKVFCNPIKSAKHLGASFIFDISRENALFFWGEFIESSSHRFSSEPVSMFFPNILPENNSDFNDAKAYRQNKHGIEVRLTLLTNA